MGGLHAGVVLLAAAAAAVAVAEAGAVVNYNMRPHQGDNHMAQAARIFGGVNASTHEFPSQVYILSTIVDDEDSYPQSLFCGGTLLSPKWVLTAAHCIKNSISTMVGYGTANRRKLEFSFAEQLIPHELYYLYGRNDNDAANDLGLIELEEPIDLNQWSTAAAQLPVPHQDVPIGKAEVVIGWGRWTYDFTQESPGSAVTLQKLNVHVFQCPNDTPNVICIKSEVGTGICDGDSGGPLYIDGFIYGVASYVDNEDRNPYLDPNTHCNERGSWAVFMSVPAYREWIREHTGL